MNEKRYATQVVDLLSIAEHAALESLIAGETLAGLAHRRSMTIDEVHDLVDVMKWKMGVTSNADAVRIGQMAGLVCHPVASSAAMKGDQAGARRQ